MSREHNGKKREASVAIRHVQSLYSVLLRIQLWHTWCELMCERGKPKETQKHTTTRAHSYVTRSDQNFSVEENALRGKSHIPAP